MNRTLKSMLIFNFIFLSFIVSIAQGKSVQKTPFSKFSYSQIMSLSVEQVKEMADEGDADARLRMATICLGNKNIPGAVDWCKKTFEAGNIQGADYIAQLYLNKAVDGTQNVKEAMKWFQREIDKGADLNFEFGKLYKNGEKGFPKDLEKAVYYLNRAAEKNNKIAIVWLAEMYVKGEGVKKDPAKAKELMSRLSEKDITEDGLGRDVLSEVEGYEVKKPLQGNICSEEADLPNFFILRRVYRERGESSYQSYFVNPDGDLTKEKVSDIDSNPEEEVPVDHDAVLKTTGKGIGVVPSSGQIVSSSGKWSVLQPNQDKWGDLTMKVRDVVQGVERKIDIPGGGWGWNAIGWSAKRDLFYFSILIGDSTGRASAYWQFNPVAKSFVEIGTGQALILEPDGHWVVWVNGGGQGDWVDHQINVYNIDGNKNYLITGGHSDNKFYKWDALKVTEQEGLKKDVLTANEFLEKGKKLYKQNRFEEAVVQYKKALKLEPNSSQIYGFLGYSYYRDQQLIKAIGYLQTSIKLNPQESMSYYNLSLAYWANRESGESVKELKALFALDPKYKKEVALDPQFKEILKSPYYKYEFKD